CDRKTDEGRRDSETFLAYMLPAGVPFYARYCSEDLAIGIYTMWRDFDARGADFHPYWRELPGFRPQCDPAQVQVSAYTHPDRLLVVAGNTSDQEQRVTIEVDGQTLGLGTDATVRRTFPERDATFAGGRLEMTVPAFSFALVWLG
ncbi:MAG TPA: glycoside hydrolase domain-containing protein, partial [Armatimonadota bacterium]|nr:glycoside hydrolase domain-containing protein [Armatimonadota bacterium]